ncbi:MAG: hypothetical protein OXC26_00920 [Albidovulum sp.]|nr:hypothetical protein [Albidovulum sp.]
MLPAVLTGIGGGAGAILLKKIGSTFDTQERVLVSVIAGIVTSFSVFFVVGTVVGVVANERAQIRETNEAVRIQVDSIRQRITQRYEYLTRCTDELTRLNEIRRKASASHSLEPLTISQVCIVLDPATSLDRPLVSLPEDTEILRLSRKTEDEHYEYLERCTVSQARVNTERMNLQLKPLTIDQVCPALGSI